MDDLMFWTLVLAAVVIAIVFYRPLLISIIVFLFVLSAIPALMGFAVLFFLSTIDSDIVQKREIRDFITRSKHRFWRDF